MYQFKNKLLKNMRSHNQKSKNQKHLHLHTSSLSRSMIVMLIKLIISNWKFRVNNLNNIVALGIAVDKPVVLCGNSTVLIITNNRLLLSKKI